MMLRTVNLHGHEIRYLIEGHGPVVLLIHGMAGSSRTWTQATRLLARDYTVIAPDLLGHGESAKPLADYSLGSLATSLRDLMIALDIERATIVGQSLGGGIAMQLAYQHPELCERLVLVGSGGLGREVNWALRLCALPGAEIWMPLVFPGFVRDLGNRVSLFLKRRGVRAPHMVEMWRAYSSLADPDSRRVFLRTLRAVVDPTGQMVSATDRLYLAAAMPTLIVWGDRDEIIPVAHAHVAHAHMPGSRLEIFEDAGHFVHAERPERFARVVHDFIERTDAAPQSAQAYRDRLMAGSA